MSDYFYDRRSSFERRANLHYDSAEEDAAWIASEVIRKGKSHGWVEEPGEKAVAAEIEKILAKYNIGYTGEGTWTHHTGGTRNFLLHTEKEP
jgi:hypothetical protein